MSERPEYIKCISRTVVPQLGKSWCGRDVRNEWAFTNVDHALENAVDDGRLLACEACVEVICGTWRESE